MILLGCGVICCQRVPMPRRTDATLLPGPLGGGAPSGLNGEPIRTIDKLSRRRPELSATYYVGQTDELTLDGRQQWRDMVGNDSEGVIQRITDTPRKHDIQHLVHGARQHRPHRRREHSKTLKDGPLDGSVLFATLSQMVLDCFDDIIQIRSHATTQLRRHMPQRDVGCPLAHERVI